MKNGIEPHPILTLRYDEPKLTPHAHYPRRLA